MKNLGLAISIIGLLIFVSALLNIQRIVTIHSLQTEQIICQQQSDPSCIAKAIAFSDKEKRLTIIEIIIAMLLTIPGFAVYRKFDER